MVLPLIAIAQAATIWIEAAGAYLPNASGDAPSVSITSASTSTRTFGGATRPLNVAMGFAGVRMGMDFVIGDRWIVPLVGIGFSGAVGVYSDWLTSVDGTAVRVHPAGGFLADADILGLGVRFKKRRWMFEARVAPGVAMMGLPVAAADGKTWTDLDPPLALSPTLRASLSLCRRLDPMERVCAMVVPNVYEWGWGNGGSISLRWEMGP